MIGRFINADNEISGIGGDMLGYNMFSYCFNNPINLNDEDGNWPTWMKKLTKAVSRATVKAVKKIQKVVNKIKADVKNYSKKNTDEQKVLQSNYFSGYKGKLVIRTNGARSGSFGVLFITRETNNRNYPEDVVRHEYGHTEQLNQLGVVKYAIGIGIPSLLTPSDEDYYNKPWEVTADIYGGVQSRTPTQSTIDAGFAYLQVLENIKRPNTLPVIGVE